MKMKMHRLCALLSGQRFSALHWNFCFKIIVNRLNYETFISKMITFLFHMVFSCPKKANKSPKKKWPVKKKTENISTDFT